MTTSPLERSFKQLSLRERKKLKTRIAIQEHALRLFAEQGYDATTIEQIAEAAEVSPSTFFRYYPTKEDVVLTDEYDPLIAETFRRQPPDLSPLEALQRTILDLFDSMTEEDQQRMTDRIRLALSVPALRARQWQGLEETEDLLCTLVAERLGRHPDDFELRAFSLAVIGVFRAAMVTWIESDATEDLRVLLDRGVGFLSAGCPL